MTCPHSCLRHLLAADLGGSACHLTACAMPPTMLAAGASPPPTAAYARRRPVVQHGQSPRPGVSFLRGDYEQSCKEIASTLPRDGEHAPGDWRYGDKEGLNRWTWDRCPQGHKRISRKSGAVGGSFTRLLSAIAPESSCTTPGAMQPERACYARASSSIGRATRPDALS